MLCTFSKDLSAACVPCDDWRITTVESVARLEKTRVNVKWARNLQVRFTLPDASTETHDSVIRALLMLDPDATIRTSRATFEGLEDFTAQFKVRVGQ